MGKIEKELKMNYFIHQLENYVNPHFKGVDFELPVIGLTELLRQYHSSPALIKEITNPQIFKIITKIIKESTFLNIPDNITIKNKFVTRFIKIIKIIFINGSERNLLDLFELVKDLDFIKGLGKELKTIIFDEKLEFRQSVSLINEILLLMIENLIAKGYSKEILYGRIKAELVLDEINEDVVKNILDNIINYISKEKVIESVSLKIKKLNPEENMGIENNIKSLIINSVFKEDIETCTINKLSPEETEIRIEIGSIGVTHKKNICKKINHMLFRIENSLKEGVLEIDKRELIENSELTSNPQDSKLKIKYLSKLLLQKSNEDLKEHQILFLDKIMNGLENIDDRNKQVSFNTLWSMLEFILIEDTNDNKIETVIRNFKPYMAIFYFRKSLKKFENYLKHNGKTISTSLDEYLTEKFSGSFEDFEELNAKKKLIVSIFATKDASKISDMWQHDEKVDYVAIGKHRIFVYKPIEQLNDFERVIETDLKQMYRLRNMLTHSGEIDNLVLENTYFRLRYYVQTLINSICFNWINDQSNLNIFELHELKQVDYNDYRETIKKNNKPLAFCEFNSNSSYLKYPEL